MEAFTRLYEHGVLHRDIKGASIFRTEEMKTIKLGDFVCVVTIKAHTHCLLALKQTLAPEVFTRNLFVHQPHARAAAQILLRFCLVKEYSIAKSSAVHAFVDFQVKFPQNSVRNYSGICGLIKSQCLEV